MLVPVVGVRKVRMRVRQQGVRVGVDVRLARRIVRPMRMLVVLVVNVQMGMSHGLVGMLMLMRLRQV